jgi:MFS family permease
VTAIADQTGYFALVRNNINLRRLWLGDIISLLGDWFNTIALYSIVEALTGSPFALGMVFVVKMLPFALASPIAGLIADRFNRRRLMIAADLVRAVVVLGLLLVNETSDLWLLYLLAAAQVTVGAFFIPARSASIPNITSDHELLTANALLSATWSVLLAIGAALGGFATQWLGPHTVFVIDSATYLVSAWFIFRTVIPQHTEPVPEGGLFATAHRQMIEGWRVMRETPQIGRIALAKTAWAVGGSACVFMLTLLGEVLTPGKVAVGIGILFSLRGLGTGIGPVLARLWFKNEDHWAAVIGWSITASGILYLVVSLSSWTIPVLIGCLVMLAHVPSGANWVLSSVLLQKRTPDEIRGRVFATEWLLLTLTDATAIIVASLLLEGTFFPVSLRLGFLLFALVEVLVGLAWVIYIVPRERKYSMSLSG